jgi:hypothetical protein
MSERNSNRKPSDQLTPIRTNIGKEDDKQQGEQQAKQSGKQEDMESLFGAAPLIPGDDPVTYNNMLADVGATFKLTDIIGKFVTWKFTHGLWMLKRLQLVQTTILKESVGINLHLEQGDRARAIAMAMTENIELFERLDRQIAGREHDLKETYRMAERHKANLDTTFKRAPEQVEDVEFSEVDDGSGVGQGSGERGEDHK